MVTPFKARRRKTKQVSRKREKRKRKLVTRSFYVIPENRKIRIVFVGGTVFAGERMKDTFYGLLAKNDLANRSNLTSRFDLNSTGMFGTSITARDFLRTILLSKSTIIVIDPNLIRSVKNTFPKLARHLRGKRVFKVDEFEKQSWEKHFLQLIKKFERNNQRQ